jgi:hypothetical protein
MNSDNPEHQALMQELDSIVLEMKAWGYQRTKEELMRSVYYLLNDDHLVPKALYDKILAVVDAGVVQVQTGAGTRKERLCWRVPSSREGGNPYICFEKFCPCRSYGELALKGEYMPTQIMCKVSGHSFY